MEIKQLKAKEYISTINKTAKAIIKTWVIDSNKLRSSTIEFTIYAGKRSQAPSDSKDKLKDTTSMALVEELDQANKD